MEKKPDWIFSCRKCQYEFYVDKKELKKMPAGECPQCGEKTEGNWILSGEADINNC